MAYIRDVKSPSWKPTLMLGHGECKKVDDSRYNRLREYNAGRPTSSISAPTDQVESYRGVGIVI